MKRLIPFSPFSPFSPLSPRSPHFSSHSAPRFPLLAAALLLSTAAYSQVGSQRYDLAVGVNGGYCLNKVGFTPRINQFYHTAPNVGLTFRYTSEVYFGMICAFQGEVNYAGSGWREKVYSARNERLDDTYSRNLHYLQVPLLANLGFGHIDRGFKGYLVAGPQLSYLLGEDEVKSEQWTTNAAGDPDRINNVIEQYGRLVENKFEYGITAGLGCELTTRIGHFLLEGRYYMGLSNLYGNSKSDPFAKSNNSTITAKITYLFDLRH